MPLVATQAVFAPGRTEYAEHLDITCRRVVAGIGRNDIDHAGTTLDRNLAHARMVLADRVPARLLAEQLADCMPQRPNGGSGPLTGARLQ